MTKTTATSKKNKKSKKAKKAEIWERENPETTHKKLTKQQKAKAKRTAEKHGRSTPSLVDNINASKQ